MRMKLHKSTVTSLFITTCLMVTTMAGADRIGPLAAAGTSDAVKKAVEEKGYRVSLGEGWTADFWVARALPTVNTGAAGALYPDIANGEFVAVVSYSKGASDFRGQAIPGGVYTLRYQYIPQDANHMGVSPNPDFLLAIPVTADTNPEEKMAFQRLVSLSERASGTAHPAVIALAPTGEAGAVAKDDSGMTVLTVEVPTTAGKKEKLGIVVRGQATQ